MGLCRLGETLSTISFSVAIILSIMIPAFVASGIPVDTRFLPTINLSEFYSRIIAFALRPSVPNNVLQFIDVASFVTLSIVLTSTTLYLSIWYALYMVAGPVAVFALPFFGLLNIALDWYIAYVLSMKKIPCP